MLTKDKSGNGYTQFSHAGIVCGEILIVLGNDNVGIWNVHIDYRLRGNGLGQIMMQECLEYIEENYGDKISRIWLRVKPDNFVARHIYEKLGFKYTDEDRELVHSLGMEKQNGN